MIRYAEIKGSPSLPRRASGIGGSPPRRRSQVAVVTGLGVTQPRGAQPLTTAFIRSGR